MRRLILTFLIVFVALAVFPPLVYHAWSVITDWLRWGGGP